MTAQTPAPQASGVSALLASFSTVPPPPQTPAKEDFSAVILQAQMAQPGGPDSTPSGQSAKDAEKSSSKGAATPDPTTAHLLLAWLFPPLTTLPQWAALKISAPSFPAVPSGLPGQTGAEPDSAKQKPSSTEAAAPDLSVAGMLLALLCPPLPILPQLPARKVSAPSVPVVPSGPPAQPPAAQTAAQAKPAMTDAVEKTPLAQVLTPVPDDSESKTQALSGTPVANTSQRMSFISERNENAGRTEQKLPLTAISAVSSANTGDPSTDDGAKSSLAFSWHDAPPETLTITDVSAQAVSLVAPVAQATVDAPVHATSPAAAAPTERLERLISREVMTIRQSSAETLGVSLKLDPNTQIFLQLTTHNGSVQASVSCERGTFAPEDAQWAQLQQSLARQNVALMPMTGSSNLNFQQSSEERPRQQSAAREEWASTGAVVLPAPPRKQKEQNHSRRNWESWA